jgi:hypothetical protein
MSLEKNLRGGVKYLQWGGVYFTPDQYSFNFTKLTLTIVPESCEMLTSQNTDLKSWSRYIVNSNEIK